MNRTLVLAAAAAATLFTATAANAARVGWSIGINVPPVATYVSSAPAYYGAPAYYAPAPAYYVPAPYYAPQVVEYAPRPRIWVPPLPRPSWFRGHDAWHHDGDRGRDDHRGGDHRDGRVDWRR